MKEFWEAFLSITLSVVVSVFFVKTILLDWIKTRLEQSIKHEYDKKLEELKREVKRREQSALVADLFSKWMFIKDENSPPNARLLNKLSFEMSLWLPDEVAAEINKRLKGLTGAQPVQNLLIECRKIIQGADTKLKPEEITFFGI